MSRDEDYNCLEKNRKRISFCILTNELAGQEVEKPFL